MKLSIESLRLKFRNKIYLPLTSGSRRKKLLFNDFSIISNNCWGGTIYESYGIKKMSPTVGMFIMPEDYLKFVSNLEHYVKLPLKFIKPDESKWREQLKDKSNWGTYLIACLDDVELHMLHYHVEESAKKKWESRVQRLNYNKLIFKFNDQNGCKPEHIVKFMDLPLKNKICFVARPEMNVKDNVILVSQPKRYKTGIMASREPYGKTKYIDLTTYINQLGE